MDRGPVTPDLQPSLYRVAVTALIIAGLANILLWRLSGTDDWFANVVAVASGLAAVALIASAVLPGMSRWREEALLLTFAVWSANVIEFAFETDARWESRVRQCGMYAGFAVLALGTYIAQRVKRAE